MHATCPENRVLYFAALTVLTDHREPPRCAMFQIDHVVPIC
jgi:hypothetical protein